ncbi:MAG: S8 family serine peptidase [Saprospiraceae bacterium]|nr:S8 family serine peptidase [Saprospiraceae bacterium]
MWLRQFSSCLILCLTSLMLNAQISPDKPNSLLVKFKEGSNYDTVINRHKRSYANRSNIRMISSRKSIFKLDFEEKQDVETAKSQLEQEPTVELVQYNYKLNRRGGTATPNDPFFPEQWNLDRIGVQNLWDRTTGGRSPCGDTIVIAVFDYGFDQEHEDLQNVIWYNKGEIPNNNFDDDQNGYKDDYAGLNLDTGDDKHGVDPEYHGTSVSSVITANSNNGIGIAGVNWQVKLLIISSEEKSQALAVEAFEYIRALRQKYNETNGAEGAYIVAVNNSWGQEGLFEEDFQLMCDMFNDLGEVGILSVGSTENDQSNTDLFGDIPSDCSSDYLIIVTNTDQNDELAVAAWGKENVDLGAPGEQIQVAGPNNSYRKDSGTSFSAPLVTGAIGLLYSLNEATFCDDARLSPTEAILNLKRYLLDGVTEASTLKDKTVSGGILNLGRSADMVTGIKEPTNLAVQVYPNPVFDQFYLDLTSLSGSIQLSIVDLAGKVLSRHNIKAGSNGMTIDCGSWPAGPYFLRIRSENESGYQKIIKVD